MTRYLVRRAIASLFTIWVATLAVSLMIRLVPGDPVRLIFAQSQTTSAAQIEEIRHELGLDRPWYEQYIMYMGRVLQGDLGKTIRGKQPVFDLLLVRIPNTLALAAASLFIALVVGGTLGFWAAYKRGSWLDTLLMTTALLGVSIPHFWLGLLLIFVFSMQLGWLPVSGTDLNNLILPALTLGLANAAIIARLTRSAMIDVFTQDYIRTARAKGLTELLVLRQHAFRNALISIVTMLGLQFTYMMGGAIVVENVFAWNGVGRFAISAITTRDYPVIQGFILFFTIVVVSVSMLLDIVYTWVDPRISYR